MAEQRKNLSKQLKAVIASVHPKDQQSTLTTLKKIFSNIIQHRNDNEHRRIKLTSGTPTSKVCQYPAGEELMKMSGWVMEGDHLRLRDESRVQIILELLEEEIKTTGAVPMLHSPKISESCEDINPEYYNVPDAISDEIALCISRGNGTYLRHVLKQYDKRVVKNLRLTGSAPILLHAFMHKQIGIARILVMEYGADVHMLNEGNEPHFLRLFETCEPAESSQSLIIQFIQEFKLDVNRFIYMAPLHLAVLNKLFIVVRFLVGECKVNVNCTCSVLLNGTPLHIAYGIGDKRIAQCLIEHGADRDALDEHGRKPKDYELLIDSGNVYLRCSKVLRTLQALQNSVGHGKPECDHFHELSVKGLSKYEAAELTLERFPSLLKETDEGLVNAKNPEAVPKLNELSHYITSMAVSYYKIGLGLNIDEDKLKVIQNDGSLSTLENKCFKMLQVWRETDTSATWKKLCDVLQDVEMNVLADRIKKSL